MNPFIAKGRQIWQDEDYYQTLCFLLVLAILIIFSGIGLRDPWPADEPRFVEVAREMVQSGNWFFPTRGGELYPDKPPVFMWTMAAFYWLTGSIKATFMLPNAIVSVIAIICCYDISAKLWNVKTARNVGFFLLLAPQFIIQAKAAQIDAMVAAWITIAMYGLVRHFFIKTCWVWYYVAWVFMGLGVITKGVGFLPALFLIPILILHFTGKHRFESAVSWKLLLGPIFMLATIACWLLPMISLVEASNNPDYVAYKNNILFKQTGERYANSWGHIKPWYYFIVSVIPVLWFPLYFVFFNKSFWKQVRLSPALTSLLVWVVLVIVFFSISPGKRGVYVLPALPMMAILAGYAWSHHSWPSWTNKVLKALMLVLSLVLLSASVMVALEVESIVKHLDDYRSALPYALFFLVSALIWGGGFFKSRTKPIIGVFWLALSLTWVWYSTVGYMLINPIRTQAKDIMAEVQTIIGDDGELGLTKFKEQFLLYSPIPLTHFSYLSDGEEQERNAWLWIKEKPKRYILTNGDTFGCFAPEKGKVIGTAHRKEWVLYDEDSALDTCQAPKRIKRYELNATELYK
ncbi:glycosyltransferase family 39 protein [Vibrio mytili]|uniref:ArnT family glycosyltransferase n=1 Tax=Vibrio mytili TaxID=50718 RepID=UPI002F4059B2